MCLVLLVADDAKRDASVKRHGLDLDVESVAVCMRPGSSDSRPKALLVVLAADVVRGVGRCAVNGGDSGVGHVLSPCRLGTRLSRPDGTINEAVADVAQRNGQAKSRRLPLAESGSGSLNRHGDGFTVPCHGRGQCHTHAETALTQSRH
ncbi:hypothetical protein [Leptolyngbya sp. 7M]|uniref:hypothetical protein n=1 Tax=Leptolyngbya sp. 7M TaxID=2812896 RepID=UPI001B8CFB2A|nr:hypothetical protein [Leptolyngbya sp. 7M]QYO62912.1 hypothetical protein JVX88_23260 [Leptolyngbya sp. 7M]